MLLPNVLTLPLLFLGLIATGLLEFHEVEEHALAALLGYGSFAIIAVGYHRLRGYAGLGMGDAKLMGVAGAWLGLAVLPWIVFLAATAGLLFAGARLLAGQAIARSTVMSFGPFLAFAIWVIRLWQ